MQATAAHTFRHSLATRRLEASYDIRTIQELLGHKGVSTTMFDTHVLDKFGHGVRETADSAVTTAQRINALFERDRELLRKAGGRRSNLLRVHEALQRNPIISVKAGVRQTKLTQPTVGSALSALCRMGVVREITGRQRNRLFSYHEYVRILDEGTELSSDEHGWPSVSVLRKAPDV